MLYSSLKAYPSQSPLLVLSDHSIKCCHQLLPLHLLQPGLVHWPQSHRGVTALAWPHPCATIPSEVCLLCDGLTHSHRCSKVCPFWCGLTNSPQLLQVCPCCSMDLPPTQLLQGVPVVLPTDRCFEVFRHGLTHGHGHCKVSLLQWGLLHGHRCFQDLCSPSWTHPQVAVPLTGVQCLVAACPVQQHRESSRALACCQRRLVAIAVIKTFPGTAKQGDKEQSKGQKQPLTTLGS